MLFVPAVVKPSGHLVQAGWLTVVLPLADQKPAAHALHVEPPYPAVQTGRAGGCGDREGRCLFEGCVADSMDACVLRSILASEAAAVRKKPALDGYCNEERVLSVCH